MAVSGGIAVPHVDGFVESADVVRRRAQARIHGIRYVFVFVLAAMGVRGVQLCIDPDERIIAAGSTQRWEQMRLRAVRGDILAKDGRSLAASVNTPNVVVDPSLVHADEVGPLSEAVGAILGKDSQDIARLLSKPGRYAKLASRVHPETADKIRQMRHSAVFTESDSRRYYPELGLASHVLGFVSADGDGQMGLEKSMDEYLRGSTVLLQRRRDRKGLDVDRFREIDRTSPKGMDVYTTVDRQIQHYAELALADITERFEPKGAMAVVVEVDTGDILALANAPTYNPNAVGDSADPRRNRAVQDAFEPGSVIKPFLLGAALEEDIVTPNTLVDCEGGAWYVGRSRIRDDHPHDVVTASEVIKYSSNIGTAKIALELGAEKVLDYLHLFGFGHRTKIPMPGERRGFLRDVNSIRPIELATTSYGQGMTVNAVQLALATAAVANGGLRMKPRLVSKVVDEQGVPAWLQEPEVAASVLSPENAHRVAKMMASVMEPGGTGTKAIVPSYSAAGKTGTAQKVTEGVYGAARIGSFVGFAPYEDPKLAIVVVVDEPQGPIKYGGWVAGPAFSSIAEKSLRYLGVPPSKTPKEAKPQIHASVDNEVSEPDVEETLFSTDGWTMPDLNGMSMRTALLELQGLGLELELSGSGVLTTQEPEAGAPVHKDATVRLHFEPRF